MDLRSHLDPPDVPDEWWLERMRIQRDRLLAASDWTQTTDSPVNRQAWADYRQILRDFPKFWIVEPTADFPEPPAP